MENNNWEKQLGKTLVQLGRARFELQKWKKDANAWAQQVVDVLQQNVAANELKRDALLPLVTDVVDVWTNSQKYMKKYTEAKEHIDEEFRTAENMKLEPIKKRVQSMTRKPSDWSLNDMMRTWEQVRLFSTKELEQDMRNAIEEKRASAHEKT